MDDLILTGLSDPLVIPVAFAWPSPDRIVEAIGTGGAKRAQRANRAGQDQIAERFKLETATKDQIQKRLAMLKDALAKRLLADDGGLTDFRRFNLQQLTDEVDRLVKAAHGDLGQTAQRDYKAADQLGIHAIQEPMTAAQLAITKQLPGLDNPLVQAAFGNTVDLLTAPMQQYATQVKVALRGVALAGDNKFAAIAKLRDQIGGPNFQQAQYQAERIIRTELGRTFNTATYNRLVALSKDFPFLRKGWRATKDNRVRLGHKEAGVNYARGSGIKVDARFTVAVYDERAGKAPKLLGVATLLYPVDPGAKPEGRIAAGATIMCRCNGFVDFDLSEFATYTKSKVATALGDVQRPAPEPKPAPLPKPVVLKTPKTTIKAPKVKVQTPADVAAAPSVRTAGEAIGPKVQKPAGALGKFVERAYRILDRVHGDGPLDPIVFKDSNATTFFGQFGWKGGAVTGFKERRISLSKNGQTAHPFNTTFHETGHWLDMFGIGKTGVKDRADAMRLMNAGESHRLPGAGFASRMIKTNAKVMAEIPEMATLQQAIDASQTVKTLRTWASADHVEQPGRPNYMGNGSIPMGVNRDHVRYMLQDPEKFARAYAQYVATKGGGEALAELRRMQSGIEYGNVPKDRKFNHEPSGVKTYDQGTVWDYPTVWSDADFAPIAAWFDRLFESLGWLDRK